MSKKIRIIFDREGNTLDIWFDNPKKESISEEAGDEIIIKKDKKGEVIGIEKLNYVASPRKVGKLPISVSIK